MKEQIEEMIEAIKKCSCVYTDCEQECSQCSNEELYEETLNHIARTFYEAGYRKQSVGEWKVDGNDYNRRAQCSNCEKEYAVQRGMLQLHRFPYCPNCGAKMKGGE